MVVMFLYTEQIVWPCRNLGRQLAEWGKTSICAGRILDIVDKEDGTTHIHAHIPESETLDYVTTLRALTQGSGFFNREFLGYEEVPSHFQQKILKDLKKD